MNTIKSHASAYELADELDKTLATGQSVNLNLIKITKNEAGSLTVEGQFEHYGHDGQSYWPCELAYFVLFPERKRVNDWLRTYAQAA